MSISTDQRQYDDARKAQAFFRGAIDFCMKGKVPELEKHLHSFLKENSQVLIRDLLIHFKVEGRTLIHVAASSGHADVLDFILSKLSDLKEVVSLVDDKGFTPLMNATVSESDSMISTLVRLGSDVNAKNTDGATAVHYAASDGSVSRLALLVDAGATLEQTSKSGTPLHWAAGKGRSNVIKYLIDKGCDVNTLSSTGLPAVIMAAVSGCDDGVKYLVEAGADVGNIVTGNVTTLHICAENGLGGAVSALLATETGRKCCRLETSDGNLPIHLAAMAGRRDIVEQLLPFSDIDVPHDIDSLMADGARRLKDWELKAAADKEREAKEEADKEKQSLASSPGAINAAVLEEVAEHMRVISSTNGDAETASEGGAAAAAASVKEAEGHKGRGNDAFVRKNYSTAIEEYSAAIRLHSSNAAYWSNRSACYLSMGEARAALVDAEVCRRLRPEWPKGCFRLATARLALGQYEDAAVAAFEGCKLDSTNKDLKELMQKAVKLGREEHLKKVSA